MAAMGFAGAASAADIFPSPIPEPIEEGFTLTVSGVVETAFSFRDTDECDDDFTSASGPAVLAGTGTGLGVLPAASYAAGADYRSACSADNNTLIAAGGADANGFVQHDDELSHVWWDAEIRFTAEQELANGLKIKARVELEGQTAGDQIDEHWISFDGHFGLIKIGADDNALDELAVGNEEWAVFVETDDPDAQILLEENTQTGINTDPGSDANKIWYFTPRFAGLQVGVSYAPDTRIRGGSQQSDGRNHVLDSDATYIHEWAIAGNLKQTYGDYEFAVTGGYITAEAESQIDTFAECQLLADVDPDADTVATAFGGLTGDFRCGDLELWHVSAQVETSNYWIGGWYTDLDTDLGRREVTWSVSGFIKDGDWQYGLGYGNYEDEHLLGGHTDEREQWVFGIGHDLAPGVDVGAFLYYANEEAAYRKALALGDVEGITGGLAAGLSF